MRYCHYYKYKNYRKVSKVFHHQDKQNMLIGIALIEKNSDFIREMNIKKQINESDAETAQNLFNQYIKLL